MIIDVHTHIFTAESRNSYQKKLKDKDYKVIVLPWFNKNQPGWLDMNQLQEFVEGKENIFAAGTVDILGDIPKQLLDLEQLFKEKKIVGIKLYPGYQHFYPNDSKVILIAELCAKYKKPLIFHTGDFYDPENKALLKYSHPIHIDELANTCPSTSIVISHFGFPHLLETANIVARNPNVYTDISGTIDDCGSARDVKKLMKQYINDLQRVLTYFPSIKMKILFGTDFVADHLSLNKVQPYCKVITSLLNKKEQENAFHLLAEQLYFSN
jgi:hypothetical protein